MTYTKGVLEVGIQNILDRLNAHKNTIGGLLYKRVNSIVFGHRPRETGDSALPRIVINIIDYSEDTVTMAYSGSEKTGKLKLEFRLQCEKLKDDTTSGYSENVLFDGKGGGAIPLFQWFVDSLIYDVSGAYNPWLGIQLDSAPDANFIIDETGTSIEIVVDLSFAIRYTSGVMGGVITV